MPKFPRYFVSKHSSAERKMWKGDSMYFMKNKTLKILYFLSTKQEMFVKHVCPQA